ncbi:MAG: hypothetical protein JW757_05060 [Anaerolineales bacterium]|nr:hypothetical protein [Anaerolineales bacterium]
MQSVIAALNEHLGQLDNQVEKWIGTDELILSLLPGTHQQLRRLFPAGSAPMTILSQAETTYRQLLVGLSTEEHLANGYLNLRFYIMLNAFLAACHESLEKVKHNPSLDLVALVEKSYYTPYFFDRVTYTKAEILSLLDQDIHQLENASPDQTGIMLALRIRKGTALTLAESFCPLHPRLYPLVAELEHSPISKDPVIIQATISSLRKIHIAI